MNTRLDELLQGAIDLHRHSYPEVSLKLGMRTDDCESLKLARDAGMRAMVFKSHFWPTMSEVYQLRQQVSGIEAFGSITLNVTVGGLSPWAVEAAALQGAKMVWMPTWCAAHDRGRPGPAQFIPELVPSLKEYGIGEGLSVLDSAGQLLPAVKAIIRLAKELQLIVSTGHLSLEESLAVAQEAERTGFSKLVFGHPLSYHLRASLEEMSEMIRRGAFIEFTALNTFCFPGGLLKGGMLEKTVETISKLGPGHCILTTDSFMDFTPPTPEFLRMFMGALLSQGVDEESIRIMVQQNPARLLDLPLPEDKAQPVSESVSPQIDG